MVSPGKYVVPPLPDEPDDEDPVNLLKLEPVWPEVKLGEEPEYPDELPNEPAELP